MADSLFVARPKPKVRKPMIVQGVSNDLDTRMNQSGGIQAGAHPEFDTETPMDKLQKGFSGVAKHVTDFLKAHGINL